MVYKLLRIRDLEDGILMMAFRLGSHLAYICNGVAPSSAYLKSPWALNIPGEDLSAGWHRILRSLGESFNS